MRGKWIWILALAIIIMIGMTTNLREYLGGDWLFAWVIGVGIVCSLIYNLVRHGSWKGSRKTA